MGCYPDAVAFIFIVCLAVAGLAAAQDGCLPASCGDSGPAIRFPFRLKGRQPDHCGYPYPGFELSCSASNTTEVEIQYPVRASAKNIVFPLRIKIQLKEVDYLSQRIGFSPINSDCLPNQLPGEVRLNSSFSPFKIAQDYSYEYTLFNCSSKKNNNNSKTFDRYGKPVACLGDRQGYQVLAFGSFYSSSEFILPSCAKMYNISGVPSDLFSQGQQYDFMRNIYLEWSKPSCGQCEAQGLECRLKKNSTDAETECIDIPRQPRDGATKSFLHGMSKKLIITVAVVTVFVVLVVFLVLYYVISLKKKKEQKKIEKFLEDYKALRPTRFSYADIKKIIDQFKDKLGQGGYGTVYKGKISDDILVAVKVLNQFKGNGEEFINEVGTIGRIHHINVVRLVGYCADGYRRALVYEFLPHDSLGSVIRSRKQSSQLGWEKLQQIAIGIAKGLDYLHQGCNQRILHFDIKPQNILLDQNFNPKVADFGLAKLCSKEQSVVAMTAARGTIGYIAPEVFSRNFGSVSYKSDVYSYGMLLLDIVGGRKRFNSRAEESSSEIYFPEWMYSQLEKGEEITIQIDREEDSKIFKKIAIVGLWCIQWYPSDRPSMKVVIQMLEGENMPIMPPNPFGGANSPKTDTYAAASGSFSSSGIHSISHTSEGN